MAPTGLVTWRITKRLGGALDGIVVEDTMTGDAVLGQPFTAGQQVCGFGGTYTVLAVELVAGVTR